MSGPSGEAEHGLPWQDEATPEAASAFYRVAGAFARTKPWAVAADGQVLELRLPALGWERAYASILGRAGKSFGLLLFTSIEDFLACARLSAGGAARDVPLFGVSFGEAQDIPGGPLLERRARALGWSGEPGRLAYVLKTSAEQVPSPLETQDYARATACLEAVRLYVEEHRKLFRAPAGEPIEARYAVATAAGPVEVGVSTPPSGLPWVWGREEPIAGLRRQELEARLAGYRAARRLAGTGDVALERASAHVEEALHYQMSRRGTVERWTAEDVHAYLLDHYPASGVAPDDELESVPTDLDEFLVWLGKKGGGDEEALRPARERIARCRDSFLRYARDPKRFSPRKTVIRAARAEGVDLSDEEAVEAFVKGFKKRLRRDPSLLPDPQERPLHRKTWVWTPGQPAPKPQDACPCGSGRRYRRCCMPR